MNWELNSDRPVYLQLVEQLQLAVVSGELPPGSRVPSVRELAAQAAVNPNTMQRALAELETAGLVQTQRTSGRCVTTDLAHLAGAKAQLAQKHLAAFVFQMRPLGYSNAELVTLVSEYLAAEPNQIKEESDGTDFRMPESL